MKTAEEEKRRELKRRGEERILKAEGERERINEENREGREDEEKFDVYPWSRYKSM